MSVYGYDVLWVNKYGFTCAAVNMLITHNLLKGRREGGGHWSCPFSVLTTNHRHVCSLTWWSNLFTQRTKSTDVRVSPLWRHTCSQAEGFYNTASWCICLLRPNQIRLRRREARQLRGDGGTAEGKAELINDKHDRRIKGKKEELEHKWEFRGGKAGGNDESALPREWGERYLPPPRQFDDKNSVRLLSSWSVNLSSADLSPCLIH